MSSDCPAFNRAWRAHFKEANLPLPPTKVGEMYQGKPWDMDAVRTLGMKLTVDKNGNDATSADFDATNVVQWGFDMQYADNSPLAEASLFGASSFVAAEVVHVEDQLLVEDLPLAEHDPAQPRRHEPELVARRVDGLHPRQPEVPLVVRVEERVHEAARSTVDVHRNRDAGLLLVGIEPVVDLLEVVVLAGEGLAGNGDHGDRVLVHELVETLGGQPIVAGLQRNDARISAIVCSGACRCT